MGFHELLHTCRFALVTLAVALFVTACASEPASPDLGKEKRLANPLRMQQAFHRSNTQRFPSTVIRDDDGIFFASALRIVDVLDQGNRLPPHLLGQVLWMGNIKPEDQTEIKVYADGFEEIEMFFWHEGLLHVMHGPHYSTVVSIPGAPAKAQREDRSQVISARTHQTPPRQGVMKSLQAILADRAQSNERRIEALWKLRDLTNDRDMSASYTGFDRILEKTPPEFDPTKSFITAMHNGPDALRAEAARALRMRTVDTKPAIKGLIHRAKNDTSPKVRMEAALTLGYLKAKDAAGDLLSSLDDADDAARIAKVMAVRMINEWELAPAFMNAASERTREGALLALKDVQEAGAIAALDFALRASPYPAIRLQAVALLERAAHEVSLIDIAFIARVGELMPESAEPRVKNLSIPMWLAEKRKSPHLPQIIEALRVAAKDEEVSVRAAAAAFLPKLESLNVPK